MSGDSQADLSDLADLWSVCSNCRPIEIEIDGGGCQLIINGSVLIIS